MALEKSRKAIVDLAPLLEFERALSGDVIWTTRARERIAIKDMATSHLYHCVRMLEGNSPHGTTYRCDDLTRRNWIEIMNIELEKRGERKW